MEEQDNTIVIDVQLNEQDIGARLAEINQKMAEVSAETKRMKDAIKDATAGIQENEEAIFDNSQKLRQLTEDQEATQQMYESTSEQLATLTAEYDQLAQAETQDVAAMAALSEEINTVTLQQADLDQQLQQYNSEIQQVTRANQQAQQNIDGYKEAIAGATFAITENAAETRALKSEQQTLEGQVKSMGEADRKYADSLKGMKAELASLRDQYASLSAAERESAAGQDLLQHIDQLDKAVKETNYSMGEFQANVGNYPQVVTSIIPGFDNMEKVLGKLGTSMSDVAAKGGAAFKGLGTAVKTFGKAFVSWPIIVIVAVLSAIMLVVNAVRDALKRNDQMLTQVQKSLAILEPIMKIVEKSFDLIGQAVTFLIEKLSQAVEWVGRFATKLGILPAVVMETVDAKKALVQAIDDLEEKERQYTVDSAKREMEISEIKAQVADKENHTLEERQALLKKAQDLEKQDLEDKKAIAEEQLRILEETARLQGDTSDEMADKIAEAQAKVYNATKEYNDGMRALQTEANKLLAEGEKERQDALKEAQNRAKKYAEIMKQRKKELADLKKNSEDALMEENKRANDEYIHGLEQELQAKKNQLAESHDLTIEEQNRLNIEIIEAQRLLNTEKERLDATYAQQERQLAYDRFKEQQEARIAELRKTGVLTKEIEQGILDEIQAAYDTMLDENRIAAQNAADAIAQSDREAAIETANILYEEKADAYNRELGLMQTMSQQRRLLAQEDAEAIAIIDLEEATAKRDMLLEMDDETKAQLFANEEEYKLAVIEANQEVEKSYANVTKAIATQCATYMESMGSIMGSIGGVFDAMMEGMDEESEEYKEMARAQAMLSFGEIGVQMAVGLAKAIAAGAGLTFPANLAAIAAGVAAVASGIAGAISTYNKYKDYFAEGGIVGGDKYTGDKLMAHLNSGEMVLNKEQQARLFQIANTPRTSDRTMDYDQLVDAFGTALEKQPQPLLDYTEFQKFTTDVQNKTNKVTMR